MGPTTDPTISPSRRRFLAWSAAVGAAVLLGRRVGWARDRAVAPSRCHGHGPAGGPYEHPDPRPETDGSTVISVEDLGDAPHAIPIFDKVREIPQVADGILCHCGCDHGERYPSLLVCYEPGGMARWCEVCQGEANLAYRLHKAGKTLDQIRVAIDAKFG